MRLIRSLALHFTPDFTLWNAGTVEKGAEPGKSPFCAVSAAAGTYGRHILYSYIAGRLDYDNCRLCTAVSHEGDMRGIGMVLPLLNPISDIRPSFMRPDADVAFGQLTL